LKKRVSITVLILVLFIGIAYVWYVRVDHRFEEISENRVYKSALIPPDRLESFLVPAHIKTVIDLLDPGTNDALNPGKMDDILAEEKAINKINETYGTDIHHVSIPSGQVPTRETLKKFFDVLDDETSYPVLIHCYHGMGRAVIYSAVYRMEYEGWDNEAARMKTRLFPFMVDSVLHKSSFAAGTDKGDFVINYVPRNRPGSTFE
jgi:protein tyrosine phosphatase (PTP) superfamily phosphohydrolase (DUF442 family)